VGSGAELSIERRSSGGVATLARALQREPSSLSSRQPSAYGSRSGRPGARHLDARSAQALTAARIEPPSYIVKELGERPADPIKARAWDHGVQGVERYRLEHGVRDKGDAFGREPQDALARATREVAQRRLVETQRRLGLEQQLTRTRELTRSIGRDLGIGL